MNGTGTAFFNIKSEQGSPFSKIADSAIVIISDSDMNTMIENLSISDTSVFGFVYGVPAGKNRVFAVSVFDSLSTLQYYGTAAGNVEADSTVNISILLYRITGNVNINGLIIDTSFWSFFDGFESGSYKNNWSKLTNNDSITGTTKHYKEGNYSCMLKDLDGNAANLTYYFPKSMQVGKLCWWYYDEAAENSLDYDRFSIRFAKDSDTNRVLIACSDKGLAHKDNYRICIPGDTTSEIIYGDRSVGWHNIMIDKTLDSLKIYIDDQLAAGYKLDSQLYAFTVTNTSYNSNTSNYFTIIDSVCVTSSDLIVF